MITPCTNVHAFSLPSVDTHRLLELCGPLNEHFKQIEKSLDIHISNCGSRFLLRGKKRERLQLGERVLRALYSETKISVPLDATVVHLLLQETIHQNLDHEAQAITDNTESTSPFKTMHSAVRPRGKNQQRYVQTIMANDVSFGVGPAGTGKTFLAVACAVDALKRHEVQHILLVRPAVEAGEKLGFLPGDLSQKIDPYLRPLYDELYKLFGSKQIEQLMERGVIEVAPLAYMRGRTLDHSFIILDESQNTTVDQMKMFLTRIGLESKAVITGDITQVDLPRGVSSGLSHAIHVLKDVAGIGHWQFSSKDVVRHPLVQRIIEAYQTYEHHTN